MTDKGKKPSWLTVCGLGFGAGSITIEQWGEIEAVIRRLRCQTVLEIGGGFSTTCFRSLGLEVTCYETLQPWIDALKQEVANVRFVRYDYPCFPEDANRYDAAFVDGPGNAEDHRLASMCFAADRCDCVFVHDSRRAAQAELIPQVFPHEEWLQCVGSGGMSLFVSRKVELDLFGPVEEE